ncbi:MAG TPA: hypothetical protein VFN91_09800 [Myxococcaceae bacterium]|nr:hypothetical protein [Myxococcaceae bacterium]
MRNLIRSLFALSLAGAPLAMAGNAVLTSTSDVAASMATSASSAVSSSREELVVRSQVDGLQAAIDGMKRELSRLNEREDLRASFSGDLDNHPLWP